MPFYAWLEDLPADPVPKADPEDTPFTGNVYSQTKNHHFIDGSI